VASAWERAGQPYREAYARLREAEAAARRGRRDQAARALTACTKLATDLGAAPLLRLAETLVRNRTEAAMAATRLERPEQAGAPGSRDRA